ncbi:VWA domain-containing protein [Pseudoalteromonas sp.]|uniref:vWA domain-containing protein n=1 Tax=Pseudoalteromonas sp. TaxID=53249 RepID=UPI003566EB34
MDFEFIRPALLWLLPVAAALFFIALIKQKKTSSGQLIAPHLAQFVLNDEQHNSRQPLWLVALFCSLAIIFSAGPSFEKKQVPVYQSKNARVMVMDMSYSMYSTDISPNRLVQSRFKALDMIELFKEGDTALIAYAGSAYTISPLTNDATTLENLIPSLSPEIMPDKGSNVLAALEMAQTLLKQAGYLDGDIILITDGIEQQEYNEVTDFINSSAYRLNIYGIGTAQGAPIQLPEGGFLKDRYGQIVIPTLNAKQLQRLAANSGGKFARYQPSSVDIATFAPRANGELLKDDTPSHALWRIDAGIYGLLLLLPMALYLFRRAAFVGAVLFIGFLPPVPAYALELPTLLKNADQRALTAYQNKDYQQAAQAQSSQLKGAALYQQGQFEAALKAFSEDKSATGFYNYANALAKAGQLEAAIAAYEKAQAMQANFTEAADNQALVEQLLHQQQQQQQQQQGDESQQQDNAQQDQQQNPQNAAQNESTAEQDKQSGENDSQSQTDANSEGSPEQSEQGQAEQQNRPEMQAESQNAPQQQAQPATDDTEQAAAAPAENDASLNQQQHNAQQQAQAVNASELSNEEKEKAQQLNQLLRKVPDDPAILLRNKMQLEAQKRQYQRRPAGVEKSW